MAMKDLLEYQRESAFAMVAGERVMDGGFGRGIGRGGCEGVDCGVD